MSGIEKRETSWKFLHFQGIDGSRRILANFFAFHHSRAESRKGTFLGGLIDSLGREGTQGEERDKDTRMIFLFSFFLSSPLAHFSFPLFFCFSWNGRFGSRFFMCMLPMV